MDKLRAMQYFTQVVDSGSFAAAARELNVSPPAVTQMVAALEKSLATVLLVRGARRVALTTEGGAYYHFCSRTVADVRGAEARLLTGRTQPSGVLTVGMPRRVLRQCVMQHLPAFRARYPELSLDIRSVHTANEPAAEVVDAMVLHSWEHGEDMIGRDVARTRFVTCAAPAYWRARGMPRDPEELLRHSAIVYRTSQGINLDEWTYRRGKVVRSVKIRSPLIFDDREATVDAAIRGYGVVRVADMTTWPVIRERLLVPALEDWEQNDAPPLRLLYRRTAASSARVRAFVQFIEEVFEGLKRERVAAGYTEPRPQPPPKWFRRLNRFPPGTAGRIAAR